MDGNGAKFKNVPSPSSLQHKSRGFGTRGRARKKPLLGKTKHLDRGLFVFIFVPFLNAPLLPWRPFSNAIN